LFSDRASNSLQLPLAPYFFFFFFFQNLPLVTHISRCIKFGVF
jgi:hypothetical protein